MTKSFYRHSVTKIITQLDDTFAAVFGKRLEKVSERVAKAGTTVEENAAAIEAEHDAEAPAPTNEDSSKEGNK